jgi:hypothetical protein
MDGRPARHAPSARLSFRSAPGWFVVVFSAGFLIWITHKLLTLVHV